MSGGPGLLRRTLNTANPSMKRLRNDTMSAFVPLRSVLPGQALSSRRRVPPCLEPVPPRTKWSRPPRDLRRTTTTLHSCNSPQGLPDMRQRCATTRATAVAMALPVLLMVAGCGGDPTASSSAPDVAPAGHISCPLPDGPVAIAASTRADSPALEGTPSIEAVFQHAVSEEEHVTLFDTDSSPSKLGEISLASTAKNSQARDQESANQLSRLNSGLHRIRANAPEAEPLGALDQASRSVHSQNTRGTVVLMDSGLQTAGALRYQSENLLLASGQDIVGYLRTSKELPDLSGLTVVLSGIGDTSRPQASLDIASRNRLVEQWTAIAKAGGAACVHVDSQPLTNAAPTSLPRVSRVTVPKPTRPKLHLDRAIALREDSVGFQDNSDKLRDPSLARKALQTLATQIREGGHRVSLVGTTATAGNEQGRRQLSLERAEAVKHVLTSLGVPAGDISTRGAGIHYAAHVKDLDREGNVVPEAAIKNRAVFLTVLS